MRRLVRRAAATQWESQWNPDAEVLDPATLDGVDAVVNLCGVGAFTSPWTAKRRRAIRSSRVNPTRTLALTLAAREDPPVLIQQSAIGLYGTEPTEIAHTEESPAALDFLAQVVVDWETAAQPAVDAGVRVVFLRTAPVLDRAGGMLKPMRLAWSLGLAATMGDGHQRMALVSLADFLRVIDWAVATPSAVGPYNVTLPQPATNDEFTAALAGAVHRPHLLQVPAMALELGLGELSGQLLGDIYAVPRRLQEEDFVFVAPEVHAAVTSALHRH